MSINIDRLEMNVNLHALQPDFLNSELYYVIAENESTFRFAEWDEEPEADEEKFYCFLTEQELLIPAGHVLLKESYVLREYPLYPLVTNSSDFAKIIETLSSNGAGKGIRRFYDEDIDAIKEGLEERFGQVEKHLVTSRQGRHLLFLLEDIEISISATMVYFRYKTPFNERHYQHVKEEKRENQ
jgi:hypothetical protein